MNGALLRPAVSKALARPAVEVAGCAFSYDGGGYGPTARLMRHVDHVDVGSGGGIECAGERRGAV